MTGSNEPRVLTTIIFWDKGSLARLAWLRSGIGGVLTAQRVPEEGDETNRDGSRTTIVLWSARSVTCPLSGTAVSALWTQDAFTGIPGCRRGHKQAAPKRARLRTPASHLAASSLSSRAGSAARQHQQLLHSEVKANLAQLFGAATWGAHAHYYHYHHQLHA